MRLSRLLPCAVLGMVLTAASASAQNANVTVIHGIPGLPQPVSVFANNGKLFDFDYGQQRGPLSLAPGNYALEVRLGNTPVLNLNASLMADTDYTVIAHLDENGNNKLSAFVNDVTTLGMGKSRLVVRHTAEAPAVDVRLNAPNFTAGFFQNLSNPNEVQADVDAGNYEADIFVAGTSTKAFGPAQLALEPGYSYIAYAVGQALQPSFQLIVQRIAITPATVTVLHGIPGLGQPASIFADNGKLFDFDYGQQRQLSLPADSYALEVRVGSTSVLSTNATVVPEGNYSVIAHLDASGNPTLSTFVNDTSKTKFGDARVTIRHTAEAPAVDIEVLRDQNQIAVLRNLSNPNEVTAQLPEGNYDANLFVANTTTKAFGPASLSLARGDSYIVYAVGQALQPSFQLLVQVIDTDEQSGLKSSIFGMSCGGRIWVSNPSPRFGEQFEVELFGAESLGLALLNLGFSNTSFGGTRSRYRSPRSAPPAARSTTTSSS
jgi:intracellular sulfur oxidation DsrE/DsrF family protein